VTKTTRGRVRHGESFSTGIGIGRGRRGSLGGTSSRKTTVSALIKILIECWNIGID